VESPRLLVLVVVNQSSVGGETFGGRVAAPAAASILQQALAHLHISPDKSLLKEAARVKKWGQVDEKRHH
jgi:cell division protein FtsI (penicillin-binding protein 3)/stage V sporulation protein D (sporulation-specific penicillin-binding protein)